MFRSPPRSGGARETETQEPEDEIDEILEDAVEEP